MRISFPFICILFSWMLFISPAMATDDMCPQDPAAIKNVPGDVAGVQADIDRLNLCVERAQLLKQMDDIAKQRSDILHKVTNPDSGTGMGSMGMGGMGAIPSLPMNALPALPAIKPMGDIKIHAPSGAPFDAEGIEDKLKDAVKPKSTTWKIRKIFGQAGGVEGATMHAQLTDGSGTLLNVVKGDPLPDGSSVDSVSIKGVTLKGNGKVTPLSWDDAAGADDAGAAPAPQNNLTKMPDLSKGPK
jgi:hypothetical protein